MVEKGLVVLGVEDPAEFELFARAAAELGLQARSWKDADLPGGTAQGIRLVVLDTAMRQPCAYEAAWTLKGRGGPRVLLLADPAFRSAAQALADFTGARILFRPIRPESALSFLREESGLRERPSAEGLLARREKALDRQVFSRRILEGLSGWDASEEGLVRSLLDRETGLFHQGFMKLRIEEEVKRARRFHQVLTLLAVRLEAPPGWTGPPPAELLLSLSGRLLSETRDIDLLGRWGEDALVLLLPGTPPDGAAAMMRRVFPDAREILARAGGWKAPVGIAQAPAEGVEKGRDLLGAAWTALEEARTNLAGGDLVALAGPAE